MMNERSDDTSRLLSGYRAVRRVAPPDAPWPGVLTRMPDDELCVLVDAARLGESWSGWSMPEAAHVLAPVDVIRRPGGHDVALPVCAERVAEFLARRARADAPLAEGESVTMAVSLLRGAAEFARRHPDQPSEGEWWLTETGRPVLATETGADGALSLEAILESLAASAGSRLAPVLQDAASSAREQRTLLRDLEQLERRLFETAEALPLETSVFAPLRARVVDPLRRVESDGAEAVPHVSWFRALTGHIDSDFTELVSVVTTDAWRRVRSRKVGGRRRPWLVATGLAGAIVCIGLLWPGGAGGPATADDASEAAPAPSATAAATVDSDAVGEAVPTPAVSGTEPAAASGWVEQVNALVDARQRCDDDPVCLASVVEDPSRPFPAGLIDVPEARRSTTLLDDFGGAAVLRIDDLTGSANAQLVFVVRVDQRTLLRDVHDIAEQSE